MGNPVQELPKPLISKKNCLDKMVIWFQKPSHHFLVRIMLYTLTFFAVLILTATVLFSWVVYAIAKSSEKLRQEALRLDEYQKHKKIFESIYDKGCLHAFRIGLESKEKDTLHIAQSRFN